MNAVAEEMAGAPPVIDLIEVGAIESNPANPRLFHKDDTKDPGLVELAASVRAVGILEPVLVREIGHGRYQLVAGERRWRAARLAGLPHVPAIVRELDDAQMLELLVTENLQREDLKPLEEARGVRALLDARGWSVADVAGHLGRSASWVALRSRLTELSPTWMAAATDPESPVSGWPVGHLVAIARLAPDAQEALAKEHPWWFCGDDDVVPSRTEVERDVNDLLRRLAKAPWKLDDGALYPEAGPCAACDKRSACNPGLFEDEDVDDPRKTDRCLDAVCWAEKDRRFLAAREAELRAKYKDLVLIDDRHGKEHRSGAIGSWNTSKSRKGAAGAVPALVVGGAAAGELRWVTISPGIGTGQKRPHAQGADGTPLPTPLSERRKTLEVRRIAKAVTLLEEALVASEPPEARLLLVLAAVFGTGDRYEVRGVHLWEEGEDGLDYVEVWQAFDRLSAAPSDELTVRRLWNQVKKVLRKRLQYWSGCPIDALWREAGQIATVIGVDVDACLRTATEALPEPKSWAHLNADGTPKSVSARAERLRAEQAEVDAAVAETTTRRRRGRKASVGVGEGVPSAPKRARKAKAKPVPGVCRVCGCTDEDCSGCIERTGGPCTWVEPDLCSACVEGKSERLER